MPSKKYIKATYVTARPMKEGAYVASYIQPSDKDGYLVTTDTDNTMWLPKEHFEKTYTEVEEDGDGENE